MAIVFDEVSGEIAAPPPSAPAAAPVRPAEADPAGIDAEALHRALVHRERLLARLSAD